MEIFGILFSTGETFLLGAAGSLAIVFLGILASSEARRASDLRVAAHAYKLAFAPEIAAVADDRFTVDTLASGFQRHETAVNVIRPFLPKRYQRKLQEAWDEYCGKGTGLGFEPVEYVQACTALLYSTEKGGFADLKRRFATLHGCLDDLL